MTARIAHRQIGSALVEFIVLTLVMIPLFAGIPLIGKLTDLRLVAINASRYAAWEVAVSPAETHPELVADRFFSAQGGPLAQRWQSTQENPLWGEADPDRDDWIVRAGVEIARSQSGALRPRVDISPDGPALAVSEGLAQTGDLLDWSARTEWGLPGDGLTQVRVLVPVQSSELLPVTAPNCEAGIELFGCVVERNTILVDGWGAAGNAQAANRTRSLVPSAVLDPLGNALSTLGVIPVLDELDPLDQVFGLVEMSPLPDNEGRLLQRYNGDDSEAYRTDPNGGGA